MTNVFSLPGRRNEAASKPRKEFIPKTLADLPSMGGDLHHGRTTPSGLTDGLNGTSNASKTPAVSPGAGPGGWDPFGNNSNSSNAQQRESLTIPELSSDLVFKLFCLFGCSGTSGGSERCTSDTELYSGLRFRSRESRRVGIQGERDIKRSTCIRSRRFLMRMICCWF